MNICVYGSYSKKQKNEYIKMAKDIGDDFAKRNHNLIFGGGKNGLVGIIAKKLTENDNETVGVILNDSDMDNFVYKECTKLIYKENMSVRKMEMEKLSDGFIIIPGGIGTLDEFFEILVLKSKGIIDKPIAVFNYKGFFDEMIKCLDNFIKEEMMSENIYDLFLLTDDIGKMFDYLEKY